MCPTPEPCDNYVPNIELAKAQGHLCFGMGYSAPCRNCGQDEIRHSRARSYDFLDRLND